MSNKNNNGSSATIREVFLGFQRIEDQIDNIAERYDKRFIVVEKSVSNIEAKASIIAVFVAFFISVAGIVVDILVRR